MRVAESGIRTRDDVRRLADAGFDAVLVGEALVTAAGPGGGARRVDRGGQLVEGHQAVLIKICGTTSEDDALLAVAMGANAIGFVFAPSPRQVSPQRVADIVKRLPREDILTVGVFRDDAPRRVVEVVYAAGLQAAQLHGREIPRRRRSGCARGSRW